MYIMKNIVFMIENANGKLCIRFKGQQIVNQINDPEEVGNNLEKKGWNGIKSSHHSSDLKIARKKKNQREKQNQRETTRQKKRQREKRRETRKMKWKEGEEVWRKNKNTSLVKEIDIVGPNRVLDSPILMRLSVKIEIETRNVSLGLWNGKFPCRYTINKAK